MITRNQLSALFFAAALATASGGGGAANAAPSPGTTSSASASAAAADPGADVGGYATTSGPVVDLGYSMAAKPPYSWTGQQDTCLNWLWTKESNWSTTAANPTSDARGIAQKISGWSSDYPPGDAAAQITWGLNYIAHTPYGTNTPCGAWSHELTDNWY